LWVYQTSYILRRAVKILIRYIYTYLGFRVFGLCFSHNFFIFKWIFSYILRKSYEKISYWANLIDWLLRDNWSFHLFYIAHSIYIYPVLFWCKCLCLLQRGRILITSWCLYTGVGKTLSLITYNDFRSLLFAGFQY
jgi:hypothetical protein